MSALKEIARKAAGLVVKKVTTVEPDGCGGTEEVTKTKAREGVKGLGWIAGFLIVWHFLIQPVLAYHFPNISFPTLDFGWISGLLMSI